MKFVGQKQGYIDTERYVYINSSNEDIKITLGIIPVLNDGNTRVLFIWNSETEDIEPGMMCS